MCDTHPVSDEERRLVQALLDECPRPLIATGSVSWSQHRYGELRHLMDIHRTAGFGCYLMEAFDDLEAWLGHFTFFPTEAQQEHDEWRVASGSFHG